MSEVRKTLEYCRNVLWWLLVKNEKGELQLDKQQRAVVDQAERLAEEALKNEEQEPEDGS